MKPHPKPKRHMMTAKEKEHLRAHLYIEQGEICPLCARWGTLEEFHLHHKKTRGAGGDDSEDNLEMICWSCHRMKHDGMI